MNHKIQIWLRPDQAECADACLSYLINGCDARVRNNSAASTIDDFGLRRTIERLTELRDVIRAGVAEATKTV